MRMQNSSCSWYLVLCFFICGCRVHSAKVGTLSGSLDMRMRSSTCHSWWYFVWIFGYEDAELLLRKYVLCLDFCINIDPPGVLDMRMQSSSCFFLYGNAKFILSKLELCLGILDMRMQR